MAGTASGVPPCLGGDELPLVGASRRPRGPAIRRGSPRRQPTWRPRWACKRNKPRSVNSSRLGSTSPPTEEPMVLRTERPGKGARERRRGRQGTAPPRAGSRAAVPRARGMSRRTGGRSALGGPFPAQAGPNLWLHRLRQRSAGPRAQGHRGGRNRCLATARSSRRRPRSGTGAGKLRRAGSAWLIPAGAPGPSPRAGATLTGTGPSPPEVGAGSVFRLAGGCGGEGSRRPPAGARPPPAHHASAPTRQPCPGPSG